MKYILGVLLVLIALSMTVVGVAAVGEKVGDVNYSGSGKLVGHMEVIDINRNGTVIMSHDTYLDHSDFIAKIPNECKYDTIKIRQTVAGAPANCEAYIYVYDGGDINIKFDIKSIWHASGSHLYVTYNGNTVVADENNNYYVVWEPAKKEITHLVLTYTTQSAAVGEIINLSATVRDNCGNPVNRGNVSFYLNGISPAHLYVGTVPVIKGKASITYNLTKRKGFYPQGLYLLNGTYDYGEDEGIYTGFNTIIHPYLFRLK